MKNFLIVLFVSFIAVMACKQGANAELDTLKTKNMALHDELMPKSMKISEIKKQVMAKAETADAAAKELATTINTKLTTNEEKMYVWMEDLGKAMNAAGDEASQIKAYQTLLSTIETIKKDTDASLAEADLFIKGSK
jgi:hypothetical protein